MKIIKLIKCEFQKNHSEKKFFLTMVFLLSLILLVYFISHIDEYQSLPITEKEYYNIKEVKDEYKTFKTKTKDEKSYIIEEINELYKNIIDNYEISNYVETLEYLNLITEEKYALRYVIDKNNDDFKNEFDYFENKYNIVRNSIVSNYYYSVEKYSKYDTDKLKEKYENIVNFYEKARKINNNKKLLINMYQYIQLDNILTNSIYEDNNSQIIGLKNKKKIIKYAIDNDMEHDLDFIYGNYAWDIETYSNAKTSMNTSLDIGIYVLIVTIILNYDILIKEHKSKSINLTLTNNCKRWEIILSKTLYLIIQMHIIWLLFSLTIFISTIMKYGFKEFFTAKLITINNNVIEVNYILWYIKELIVNSLPFILAIVFMLLISSLTISRKTTVSISVITVLLNLLIKLSIIQNNSLYHYSFNYYEPLSLSLTVALSSIALSIVLFLVTTIVYNKKDIRT